MFHVERLRLDKRMKAAMLVTHNLAEADWVIDLEEL